MRGGPTCSENNRPGKSKNLREEGGGHRAETKGARRLIPAEGSLDQPDAGSGDFSDKSKKPASSKRHRVTQSEEAVKKEETELGSRNQREYKKSGGGSKTSSTKKRPGGEKLEQGQALPNSGKKRCEPKGCPQRKPCSKPNRAEKGVTTPRLFHYKRGRSTKTLPQPRQPEIGLQESKPGTQWTVLAAINGLGRELT